MRKSLLSRLDLAKIQFKQKQAENPARLYFFLKLKIFTYEILLSLFPLKNILKAVFSIFIKFVPEVKETAKKFFILLFFDPSKSFSTLVAESNSGNCPYSYSNHKDYQKNVRIFSAASTGIITLIIALILSSTFSQPTRAASYTFTQTDWNTLSSNTAAHASNQSGWTQYSATSTFIAASSTAMVAASTTTWTVTDDGTTDTGFNNTGASKSQTTVSGTGSGASLELSPNTTNLVALWHFNEGTGQNVTDSQGANNGTLGATSGSEASDPTWTASGKFSNALTFDGTNYVNIGNTVGASLNTTYTVEAWIKPATTAIGNYAIAAYRSTTGSTFSILFQLVQNGAGVDFVVRDDAGVIGSATKTNALTVGNWYHVVGVRNGGTLQVYVNGLEGTSGSATFGVITPNTLKIGVITTFGGGFDSYFPGTIDEVAIYNSALSASEITEHYNSGVGKQLPAAPYLTPGTFISYIFNTSGTIFFGTLSWTATTPANTALTLKARSGNQSNLSDATAWASCSNITSGAALSTGGCITNVHRYVQFQATLSTTDTSQTPTLSDVSLTYTNYSTTTQTLTSSAYDSGSAANLISKISWSATTPEGTNVKFQMRSATTSSDLTWHNWCGYEDTSANCSGGYYFTATSSNVSLPSTHTLKSAGAGSPVQDDRWFQYRILLTASPTSTPVVSDVSITYAVNARPDFDMTYGTRGVLVSSQGSDGTYAVSYKIRDVDSPQSTNGSPGPGYVSPSFEYSIDSGGSWTTITGGLSANATTSKAVDTSGGCTDNCNAYTTYSFTFTPNLISGLQNKYYNGTMQIRATIDDGEAANNSTSTTSALFSLDTKAPTVSSVLVKATTSPATISLNVTDDSTFTMKVSADSNFTGIGYVASSNSTTTSLSSDPSTVYAIFQDAYGNRSATTTATTPETPLNLITQDISNLSSREFRMFITWKVSTIGSFGSYRLYRSTDGGSTYSLRATITDINTNYYVDTGLTASSTYYYKISAMDSLGNGSFFSSAIQTIANGTQDAGEGGGGSPSDSPVISSILSSNTTPQSTTITWVTKDAAGNNKLSNSKVSYCSPAPCINYTSNQSVSSYVSSHSVALGNLSPNTTYSFVVTSQDPFKNAATSSSGTTFTTNSGPKITNVSVIDLTENTAKINWDTNVSASNNTVVYSTTNPPSGNQASSEAASTNRTVTLSNLSAATTYYFYAKSQDSDSNWGYDYNVSSGQTNYYTFKTPNDSTAPSISNIYATTTSDTTAVISWITNEEGTSQIEYGTTAGSYSKITWLNSNLDLSHAMKLSGLTAATTYYYRVASVDGSGNSASSSEKTFTTLETQIGTSQASQYAGGGGGVSSFQYFSEVEQKEKLEKLVQTLETRPDISKNDLAVLKQELENLKNKSVSREEYDRLKQELEKLKAERASLGIEENEQGKEAGKSQKPEEVIKNLAAKFKETMLSLSGTLTISETEEALKETTESLEELSKIVPPPILSSEPQVEIDSNYAVISWKTNKDANSVVNYAMDNSYSPTQPEPYTAQTGNLEELVKDHEVKLENLSPATVYHYQLKSKAKIGDYAESKDFSFITKSEAPRIMGPSIQRTGLTGAKINWKTLTLADSLVKYTPVREGKRIEKESKTEGAPNFVLNHEIDLKNLTPDTGYFVDVFSKDNFGNIETKSLGSFFTSKDTTAPFISQVKVETSILPGQEGRIQAIITWKTDELSSSQVAYEQGSNFKETPQNLTPLDRNFTTTHTIVLTNFRAGILYRFRVLSKDTDGNESQTKDYTIFTPQVAKGIMEIILENFEQTFGWTKKLGF